MNTPLVLPLFIYELIWYFIGLKLDQDSILVKNKYCDMLALWYPKHELLIVHFLDSAHIYHSVNEFHLNQIWELPS